MLKNLSTHLFYRLIYGHLQADNVSQMELIFQMCNLDPLLSRQPALGITFLK